MTSIAAVVVLTFFWNSTEVSGQDVLPEVFDTATIDGQLDYLEQRTRIYNGFRAIREDMFQAAVESVQDTILEATATIGRLSSDIAERDSRIELLRNDLERAREERDQAIRTKDSFSLFGLDINKGIYNTIVWLIVLGLAAAAVIIFLLFKRSHTVTSQLKRELGETREEFDAYRQSAREKQEKLVVAHHNEIMKLKKG